MLSFHGDPAVKAKYLARVRAHRDADEIVHGFYWDNGKGCGVGCTIETSRDPHAEYERQLGVPRILARLLDGIFEGLENGDAKNLPVQFIEAIPVGADLSLVWPQFAIWLLVDSEYGVLQYTKTDSQRVAIQAVADLYQRKLSGESISALTWRKAAYDAYGAADAAADAAYAAAAAADAYAAYAAAAAAAKHTARMHQGEKLLSLLSLAPVPELA